MRTVFSLALLAGAASLSAGRQPPKDPEVPRDPEPRYGLGAKPKTYPQDTAKKALGSALEAAAKADLVYLVAHLLDPGFVDARVADRAKGFEPGVEAELARVRDFQLKNPDRVEPEDRLPVDRAGFAALVAARSRERAFKQLVRDVEAKFQDDPQALRDLRKLYRDGAVADTADGAKLTHPDVKDRALFFRKVGDRFFLENRHEDAPAPAPKDLPPPKKDPGM
ncbi:MAG: hypothetical protein C0501_27485 [Isosphaera sp.]|nr:hypothetical protein [Isosphaera sp.]